MARFPALGLLSSVWLSSLLVGCGVSQPDVDGHWKGQMIATAATAAEVEQVTSQDSARPGRPRRVLLQLDQEGGVVNGLFAYSSDAVGFRQMDDGGFRQVASHTVHGTLDGSTVLLRIARDTGEDFEVDARVSGDSISGTYVRRTGTGQGGTGIRETGEFAIERY
jgi:hypothetical protein